MRSSLLVYLIIFLFVNLFVMVPAMSAAQLFGRVFYKGGEDPVKNAIIILTDPDNQEFMSNLTNEEGYCTIKLLPPNEYKIAVKVKKFRRGYKVDEESHAIKFYVQGKLEVKEANEVNLTLILNATPLYIWFMSPVGIALVGGVTGGTVYIIVDSEKDEREGSPNLPN